MKCFRAIPFENLMGGLETKNKNAWGGGRTRKKINVWGGGSYGGMG